jgi:hypothetical protein
MKKKTAKKKASKKSNGIFGAIGRAAKSTYLRGSAKRKAVRSYRKELSLESKAARAKEARRAAERALHTRIDREQEQRAERMTARREAQEQRKEQQQAARAAAQERTREQREARREQQRAAQERKRTTAEARKAEREEAANERRAEREMERMAAQHGKQGLYATNPGRKKKAAKKKAAKRATKRAKRVVNPTITPQKAKELLRLNVGNRPLDKSKVRAMAALMSRGIYKRSKPIKFVNGILTDGQHTLTAIVESGKSQKLAVSNKTLKTQRNPLFASILEGLATGTGYAIGSHIASKNLEEKKRRRAGGGTTDTIDNPKRKKRVKKNPPPHGVASLHKEFQGRPIDGTFKELDVAPGTPANLSKLGKLIEIQANGRVLKFNPARVALCADGRGNLHIAGVRYKGNPNVDMGLMESVTYDTKKNHLHGGKRFYFEHAMGEEGGRRPRLIIKNGYPRIVGGSYKIGWPGIMN